MTGEDLAEFTNDVGLVEKKGHLKRFNMQALKNLKPRKNALLL